MLLRMMGGLPWMITELSRRMAGLRRTMAGLRRTMAGLQRMMAGLRRTMAGLPMTMAELLRMTSQVPVSPLVKVTLKEMEVQMPQLETDLGIQGSLGA